VTVNVVNLQLTKTWSVPKWVFAGKRISATSWNFISPALSNNAQCRLTKNLPIEFLLFAPLSTMIDTPLSLIVIFWVTGHRSFYAQSVFKD